MKQKLSLCCALINDPDLLILDEPTTGVDPLSRGQFWDLINTIRARRPQMSVIVATAYMDEAAALRLAHGHGRRQDHRHRHTPQILQKTGEQDLDAAFIALLPEAKRAQHQKVVVRPRSPATTSVPAIEADGLTRRFGDFHRRRSCQLPHRAGRDLRLPRLERLRQVDDDEDADRPPAGDQRVGEAVRRSRWGRTTWRRAATSATCRRPSRSTANSRSGRISSCTRSSTICRASEIDGRVEELLEALRP